MRNEVHSEEFQLFDKSRTRKRILEDRAGRELAMKRMPAHLVTALHEHKVTIPKALTHPAFTAADREALARWQRDFDMELTRHAELLLPFPIK